MDALAVEALIAMAQRIPGNHAAALPALAERADRTLIEQLPGRNHLNAVTARIQEHSHPVSGKTYAGKQRTQTTHVHPATALQKSPR